MNDAKRRHCSICFVILGTASPAFDFRRRSIYVLMVVKGVFHV